jgi:hypothetical protein
MHPTLLTLRVVDSRSKLPDASRGPRKESIVRIGRTTPCILDALSCQSLTVPHSNRFTPSIVSISISRRDRLSLLQSFLEMREESPTVYPMREREQNRAQRSDHRGGDPDQMMDVLLALDRMLVEVSMHLYKLPRHERLAMRKQNRHLHKTVRQHLPRLLKRSTRRP